MTAEEAEEVVALTEIWGGGRHGALTLTCAQDVFGELQEFPVSPDVEVLVVPWYGHGSWKLTRHDSCDVTGGRTIDEALIVSHARCTVLAKN